MYDAIKKALTPLHETNSVTSISEAYEILYRRVARLFDMDDFSTELLNNIHRLISNGASPELAFKQCLDNDYDAANYDYFKDTINHYKVNLLDALNKAVASPNPQQIWNADIDWMASHSVITVGGTDYTLDELKKKLDGGGY